ncbi:hypothetical protein AB4160_15045, partial [Shewanella sp. 10N.286.51.B8]|uniref:hypothetical protein n=1 Tax=Shewanella sp. 10N.286.51.B8 TaxID=3229708 RepID=UPI0035509339
MAYFTIKEVELESGKTRHKVVVKEKNKDAPIASKSKTFDSLQEAEIWAEKTKVHLKNLCLTDTSTLRVLNTDMLIYCNHKVAALTSSCTLKRFVEAYLEYQITIDKPISDTAIGSLQIVREHDLATIPVNEITFEHLKTFCTDRLQSCEASTVRVDISNIMRVIRELAGMKKLNITDQVVKQHYPQLKRDGFIADSATRTRRLEEGEFIRILKGLFRYDKKTNIKNNYPAIFVLSIDTTLRISELMALTLKV